MGLGAVSDKLCSVSRLFVWILLVWILFWWPQKFFPPLVPNKALQVQQKHDHAETGGAQCELGRLSWLVGLGFPVQHSWALGQLPGDQIYLLCHCVLSLEGWFHGGREEIESILAYLIIEWLPGGLLLLQRWFFPLPKNQICPILAVSVVRMNRTKCFSQAAETGWDAAVPAQVRKGCAATSLTGQSLCGAAQGLEVLLCHTLGLSGHALQN